MSVDHSDEMQARDPGFAGAWAAAPGLGGRSGARSGTRLAAQIEDFFLADADRLDDRTRAATSATLRATLRAIVQDLRRHLTDRSGDAAVDAGEVPGACDRVAAAVMDRLRASGLLRDHGLMEELFARVRQDMLSDALLANRAPDADPALLPAWVASGDERLAEAARAYEQAERRRRAGWRTDLPAGQREQLVWWAAAALRQHGQAEESLRAVPDRLIADAARRSMAAADDRDSLETSADRLAAALMGNAPDLATPLIAALQEGCLALAIALLARALAIDAVEIRALMLDPADERLWLTLRVAGLDRAAMARIGFLLGDADPRRDLEGFADRLGAIAAVPVDRARDGLAMLALPRPFRAALSALGGDVDRAPGVVPNVAPGDLPDRAVRR